MTGLGRRMIAAVVLFGGLLAGCGGPTGYRAALEQVLGGNETDAAYHQMRADGLRICHESTYGFAYGVGLIATMQPDRILASLRVGVQYLCPSRLTEFDRDVRAARQ